MTTVRIVGIGSGLGPDQAGWLAIEHLKRCRWLRETCGDTVTLHECGIPADLPNLISGAGLAILIDAAIDAPGTLRVLRRHEVAADRKGCSTHGFSIWQALELMESLGNHPDRVFLLGIGIGESGHELPPTMAPCALDPGVARRMEKQLRQLLSGAVRDKPGTVGFQAPQ